MASTETFTLDYHGQPLRVVMREGEPWYVVADLCRVLNIYIRNGKPKTVEAVRRLRPGTKAYHPVDTSQGVRDVSVVNRSGLSDMAFWARHQGRPELFVWDINEAMVSGRYQTAAA